MVDVVGSSRWWFVVGVWKESTRTCAAARAETTFGMVREACELGLQNQDCDLSRSDPP